MDGCLGESLHFTTIIFLDTRCIEEPKISTASSQISCFVSLFTFKDDRNGIDLKLMVVLLHNILIYNCLLYIDVQQQTRRISSYIKKEKKKRYWNFYTIKVNHVNISLIARINRFIFTFMISWKTYMTFKSINVQTPFMAFTTKNNAVK